jgi:hypothetical protein
MKVVNFRINDEIRGVERVLWLSLDGPVPDEMFCCNGCTLSPDVLRGWRLWIACVVHDYHYHTLKPLGEGWRSRMEADAILRRNLRRVVLYDGGSLAQAERVAWLYWGRVRIFGRPAWNDAPGLCRRLWSVWVKKS